MLAAGQCRGAFQGIWGLGVKEFRVYGFRGLEFRGLGFRGLGVYGLWLSGLGFRGLEFQVYSVSQYENALISLFVAGVWVV